MGQYEEIMQRTEWFRKARFGLFVHYGLYSINGTHEWCKSRERITTEDYQKYFDSFTAEPYDPKAWAKMAKNAGMKYAVLTTKHHEGFCLFDSAYTDYKSTNTPAKRDLVKEYVEAFRAEGIKVGFYYSVIDWHHPDYPHYGDMHHPMRDNPAYGNEGRSFDNYVEYMHNQVRELCTNYGKIDVMWFDFSYADMTGEKWQATRLVKMVRELQPGIIIDNRLSYGEPLNFDKQSYFAGDFRSPEQFVPRAGMKDELGRPIPWEVCLTTQSESWGYRADNREFMSARDVVYTLVDCVSKNGNLLLNIGPNGKGDFPKPTKRLLEELAEWMYDNAASVHGCFAVGAVQPDWGRLTTDGENIYAHVFDKAGYALPVTGIKADEIAYGLYLEDNTDAKIGRFWNSDAHCGDVIIPMPSGEIKNKIDTVVKLVRKK